MNEQLQLALASILNSSMDAVQAGVSFLQAELPDVMRQLLLWKMVISMIFFTLCIVCLVACIWAAIRIVRFGLEEGCGAEAFAMFPAAAAMGLVWGSVSNLEWLQILIAPKIYLIEYAARLVK